MIEFSIEIWNQLYYYGFYQLLRNVFLIGTYIYENNVSQRELKKNFDISIKVVVQRRKGEEIITRRMD